MFPSRKTKTGKHQTEHTRGQQPQHIHSDNARNHLQSQRHQLQRLICSPMSFFSKRETELVTILTCFTSQKTDRRNFLICEREPMSHPLSKRGKRTYDYVSGDVYTEHIDGKNVKSALKIGRITILQPK